MPTLTNEQRIAIAVGVPVTAILFYLLFRRLRRDEFDNDDDEDDVETEANEVEEVASASETIIEVKVPRLAVGAVIGKGGANIKQIQKESGARLNFKDNEDEESPERTAIVRGEREKVKKAELLIKRVIAIQPVIITEEVYVPKQACGRIIGRGGQNIRQMSRISGAKVTIERSSELDQQSPLRKVTVTGTSEQILHAKGLLEEKVTEEASFAARKSENKGKSYQESGYRMEKVPETVPEDTVSSFPSGSDYVKVFVAALHDPSSFHVQMVTENASLLETLNAELTKEFLSSAETSVLNGFKTGDLCCAPFDVDNCWYRARITNISQDNMVDVFFVDFGDSSQVHKNRLRVLKNKHRTLPHQAVRCCLANVRPKDGKWSGESIESFEELTFCAQWRVLMARVRRYCGDIPCVELVDTNNPNRDVNIGEELIKKQFAVFDESYPTENALKDQCTEILEVNQDSTKVTDDSDENSKTRRKDFESKRSLSFQEYDLRTSKKAKADDVSSSNERSEHLVESISTANPRVEVHEKDSLELISSQMEKTTANGNYTPQSNLLSKQQPTSETIDQQDKKKTSDKTAAKHKSVLSNTSVASTVEEPVQMVENLTVASTPEEADFPDRGRLTDQVDALNVVSGEMKPEEELSPFNEPLSPRNESNHLHYAAIKRNLSISIEEEILKEGNTGELETLLEEKVQLGKETAFDSEQRRAAVSDDDFIRTSNSSFLGKEPPSQVSDGSESVTISNDEKNETSISEKRTDKENPSVLTSSTQHSVSPQKTYVSSVSVITKKKAKDVFVTVSSSDEKKVEGEGIDGLAIKPTRSNVMPTTQAQRASSELVINVSSSTVESQPEEEIREAEGTFTSSYMKVANSANEGNHGDYQVVGTFNSTAKKVFQLKHADTGSDLDGFVTPTSSLTSLKESPDDSDTDSFLSAREEMTSDTDTAAYLTAQASGSTTSLDYQSLDSDTDTVRLDNTLDTVHTPVNTDSEDERDSPTTPRRSFQSMQIHDEKGAEDGSILTREVSENELGYRADTESVTSREDLRQFGIS